MPAIISKIRRNSIAAELSLKKGDEIISVNGQRLRDIADYEFLTADEEITILAKTQRGLEEFEIEKDYDDDLGIEFASALFDTMKVCGANCQFCFERQLPKGLRPSLKLRDDDYRLSFLFGCYVTLGNLTEDDKNRIISQHLSPLYVSVHAADHQTRQELLGKKVPDILKQLKEYIDNGIHFHCQAVICPGINDKKILENTITKLAELAPGILSLALVPVGLTEHRQGLPQLSAVTKKDAEAIIALAEHYAAEYKEKLGTNFVWCADEFYIKAQKNIPDNDFYEDYPQYENGIGLVRTFIDDAKHSIKALNKLTLANRKIALVTGKSFESIFRTIDLGSNREAFDIIAPENRLFGKTVTVTGLLAGQDIIAAVSKEYDAVIIPSVCVNEDGIFLDDLSPQDIEKEIGTKVIISRPYISEMSKKIKKIF